jgi:hypothetical protein
VRDETGNGVSSAWSRASDSAATGQLLPVAHELPTATW